MKTRVLVVLGLSLGTFITTSVAAPTTSTAAAGQTVDLPAVGVSLTVPQGFQARLDRALDGSLIEFVLTPTQAARLTLSIAVLPGRTTASLDEAFPAALATPFGNAQLGTNLTRATAANFGPYVTALYALEDQRILLRLAYVTPAGTRVVLNAAYPRTAEDQALAQRAVNVLAGLIRTAQPDQTLQPRWAERRQQLAKTHFDSESYVFQFCQDDRAVFTKLATSKETQVQELIVDAKLVPLSADVAMLFVKPRGRAVFDLLSFLNWNDRPLKLDVALTPEVRGTFEESEYAFTSTGCLR